MIFDSQVPVGGAQAVYMAASAEQEVRPPARHRLYRALATKQFALGPRDERLRVPPAQR